MPVLSPRSHDILATCDSRLIRIMNKAIEGPLDFAVISGHRGEEEQNDLYRRGLSQRKYPNSLHCNYPSLAVDIGLWDRMLGAVDWSDSNGFYVLSGQVLRVAHDLGIPLRHGANWDMDDDWDDQSFMDLGHFELVDADV